MGKKLLSYRGPIAGDPRIAFDGVITGGDLCFRDKSDPAKLEAWATATAAINFGRHTDNFYLCYSVPGATAADFDWFDEQPFITENWRLMARAAKRAGFKGLCFDSEYYEGLPLFGYGRARHAKSRTIEEYRARVRQRGAEIMRAVNAEFPDVTILFLFGYSGNFNGVPQHPASREKLYTLVSAFVDGMLSEAGPTATIHDMHEQGFSFRISGSYERARAMMTDLMPELSFDPAAYRRHHRAGFSFWADCWENASEGRPLRVDDLEANYYTPAEFAWSVHQALRWSDKYVWMWPGVFDWWTGTCRTVDANGKPVVAPIPAGYIEALGLAHRPELTAPPRERRPNTYRVLAARTQEGWSDAETFGDLSGKYEVIYDLPVEWTFRTDPDEVGEGEGWSRPGAAADGFKPIQIREFWEPQGYSPYDGAAWYRLAWTPPALPACKRVVLAFGGVADEATVWLDGEPTYRSRFGENIRHKPFMVDVTGRIRPGRPINLAVRVWNTGWCGGIWKSVKLVAAK